MVVETFSVIPTATFASYLIFLGPAVLVIFAVFRYISSKSKAMLVALLVISVGAFAGSYFFIHEQTSTPSQITIGNGYIRISSSETGTINTSTSQISNAYVATIGTGNLTLRKDHGLNNNIDNIGVFRTGNGKTADVISDNSTDLIVQLNSGNYIIAGISGSNFTTMVSLFKQQVYPG